MAISATSSPLTIATMFKVNVLIFVVIIRQLLEIIDYEQDPLDVVISVLVELMLNFDFAITLYITILDMKRF